MKEMKEMTLTGTMGTPVFGGVDVTKVIGAFESPCSRTKIELAAEDVIVIF